MTIIIENNNTELNITTETNYEALNDVRFLDSDSGDAANKCRNVFKGGDLKDSPEFLKLIKVAKEALISTQEDITNLQNFLSKYE